MDNKTQTDVIIMDFSKACDTVPHNRLLLKCSQYRVDGKINDWLSVFLKDREQRVVVGGDFSDGQMWCQESRKGRSLAHCYFSSILTICLTTFTQRYAYLPMTVCCIRKLHPYRTHKLSKKIWRLCHHGNIAGK